MFNSQAAECRKFNREEGCTDPVCTFRHICLQCNSLSHGATNCPAGIDDPTPLGSISAVMSTVQNRRTSQQFVSADVLEERLKNLELGSQPNLSTERGESSNTDELPITDNPVEPTTEEVTNKGEREIEDNDEEEPVVPAGDGEPSDDDSSESEKPNNRKGRRRKRRKGRQPAGDPDSSSSSEDDDNGRPARPDRDFDNDRGPPRDNYPDRKSAQTYFLTSKNWGKFKGDFEPTGKEAFRFLQQTVGQISFYLSIFPEDRTGFKIGVVLEAIMNAAYEEGTPAKGWYNSESRLARKQNLTCTFGSVVEFITGFNKRFIPDQFKMIMRENLKKIKLSDYNVKREFTEAFDNALEVMELLNEAPKVEELFEILLAAISQGYLRSLTSRNMGDNQIINYWSLRKAIENDAANDSLLELQQMRSNSTGPSSYKPREKPYSKKPYQKSSSNKYYAHWGQNDSSEESSDDSPSEEETSESCSNIDICLSTLRHSNTPKVAKAAKHISHQLRNMDSFKNKTCYHCNKEGHFVRDCPDLDGSGESQIGQKFGSAKGFRETDDPTKRPQHYQDAVRQRMQHRANNMQKRQGGGKNKNTHAQREKRGQVNNPQTTQFNINVRSPAETLSSIESMFPTDIMNLYCSIAAEATENLHISVGDSSEDTDSSQDD